MRKKFLASLVIISFSNAVFAAGISIRQLNKKADATADNIAEAGRTLSQTQKEKIAIRLDEIQQIIKDENFFSARRVVSLPFETAAIEGFARGMSAVAAVPEKNKFDERVFPEAHKVLTNPNAVNSILEQRLPIRLTFIQPLALFADAKKAVLFAKKIASADKANRRFKVFKKTVLFLKSHVYIDLDNAKLVTIAERVAFAENPELSNQVFENQINPHYSACLDSQSISRIHQELYKRIAKEEINKALEAALL